MSHDAACHYTNLEQVEESSGELSMTVRCARISWTVKFIFPMINSQAIFEWR